MPWDRPAEPVTRARPRRRAPEAVRPDAGAWSGVATSAGATLPPGRALRRFRGPLAFTALAALTLGFVAATSCRPPAGASNTVVLVTIDTLRRDVVGCYGPPERLSPTPALDAFAREAVRFTDARSPAPLTLPAHVAMLAGLPPAATGMRVNAGTRIPGPNARPYPLLAETLRAHGWRTGAFVSAEPLRKVYGLDQGFEVYDDAGEDAGRSPNIERAGPVAVAHALEFLRRVPRGTPAFTWVHLYEPHGPYVRYEDDVRQADAAVALLLRGLAQLDREPAAILVTADHGEMRGELGEDAHGLLLGDAVSRVPFLLRVPGQAPGVRADPADLVDVAPTLAGLAGVPWARAPTEGFGGLDLLLGPAPETRVRVAESLYAHQRFRWAQLTSVTDARGTLVELGGGRTLWLEPATDGVPQRAFAGREPPGDLALALSRYKSSERRGQSDRLAVASPYGGAGQVEPFLTPEENGRLKNPYEHVARVPRYMQAGFRLAQLRERPDPTVHEWLREVRTLSAEDPGNPEVRSLEGFAEEALALLLESAGEDGGDARARAEEAFGHAFALGQRDARTLAKWTAVNSDAHPDVALRRLELLGHEPGIVWDAELWTLKARLLAAFPERTSDRAEACRQARDSARTPEELAALAPLCPGGP